MRDKTFVETPLYAVPLTGNDPMARSLWEDVKSLTKGDMPCLRYRGKVIWAPNGGRGFQRWPSDKAIDWAVAVYDQLGGTWGHSRNAKSKIPGGRAEGKSPKDFDSKQLLMGTEVELEHTGDRELAREIAMDHLTEIPDYYTRLLRMETQAKKASESPTLISQRHFKAEGSDVYLFLTQYQNRNHLIRVDISGSLSFGIIASGPKSNTVFKSLGDFILNGESVYSPAYEEMNTSFHETEKLFQNVTGGKFAVKFPADDNDPEAENFMHHFKQFLREWTLNGSGNEKKFPITNHPYWPTYLASLHKALKPKILYRGIHGDFADEVSDTIPVYRFSSWTADKKIARDFARYGFVGDLASGFSTKVRRKGKFVVVASAIPVEDIVMAPVVVDALPDPEILVKTLSGQDEYVVHSHRPRLPVKIVSRSASTTPTRESVFMISRIASRVFLASVADTVVNTFSFEIPLRWYGAKGGLQTRKGVEPLEYTIPAAGRLKFDITGTADIASLPPKPKVIDSDEVFENDLESFNSNVVPDDITDTLHASEFDVNDTSGEYFSLLNTRTGMVMVMHSPGLKRLTFGNKLPAKVTGTGFMVPISVFRAVYHFVPTVRVESFPEILRAMLTQVEEGVRDSDSSDWY